MKKVWQAIRSTLAVLLTLAAVFGAGFFAGSVREAPEIAVVEPDRDKSGMNLPGEKRRRFLTEEEVSAQLVEMAELATYCGVYSVSRTEDCKRYLLEDYAIPGTANTITVRCRGIVKVGYSVEEILPQVDNDSQTIYISLPKPRVLDNYIIWDSVRCQETNNILNPIAFQQYQALIEDLEAAGLKEVEEEGIYAAAQEQVQVIVRNFLGGFDGYEVVFL